MRAAPGARLWHRIREDGLMRNDRNTVRRLSAAGVIIAVVVIAGVASRTVASSDAPSSERLRPKVGTLVGGQCPRFFDPGSRGIEQSVAATRRVVPRTWRVVNQSGAVPLTPARYSIQTVARLAPAGAATEGQSVKYGQLARRLCGRLASAYSYVAVIAFPDASTARAATGVALVARTSSGWKVWYTK